MVLDITWYGLNCFRMVQRGETTVVCDPYAESFGIAAGRLRGDVVTLSHPHSDQYDPDTVQGHNFVLTGPGEYEIGGVFITGIALHHIDEKNDIARPNVAYRIKYPDGVTVLHMGSLSHVPDQSTIEDFGEVHAVLVPVGGGDTLKPSLAAEVIAQIEPYYIVPMGYALPQLDIDLDPVDKFLKAMGISRVQEEESLRVSTSSGLPEAPEVVVLQPNID